jgi:hypothetical protein
MHESWNCNNYWPGPTDFRLPARIWMAALGDSCAFAKDVNCTLAKDDKTKTFVFIKRD